MKCQPSFKKNKSLCSILIIGCWCLIFAASLHISQSNAYAAQVTLAWDTSDEAAGYKIYYGTASNNYTAVVDVGTELTYTFTDLPDGHTYYFAATAYDATHLESDYSTEISYNATTSNQTEILWRNTVNGWNSVWYMDGVNYIGSGSIATVNDLNWTIAGMGDFNGDGKPDILWRNTVNGWNRVWYMDGVNYIGSGSIATVNDLNWTIAGMGDFNGDGKPDILWRNTVNGWNRVWYMDGVNYIGSGSIATVNDLNWQIIRP
jgi:hypothetical protein